jgi:hypothetical protein
MTKPEKGQIWRRKKDGKRVVLTTHDALSDDWYWRQVDDESKRGVIYGYSLSLRYDLEVDGLTDLDIAWERWAKDFAGTHPELDRLAFEAGWNARRTI